MVSAEAVPFAKTGGLADAVSALSIALHKQGHDVRIVLPRYYNIDKKNLKKLEGPMGVPCGYREEWTAVYTADMPLKSHVSVKTAGSGDAGGADAGKKECPLPLYFIDHEQAFGRDGVYGTAQETDFEDNPFRFAILCQAAFKLCKKLHWYPDIFHVHDWSAAFAAVLLKFNEHTEVQSPFFRSASVLTIHNLGYQGIYGKHNYPCLGLAWEHFYAAGFEDYDRMNFLKAGITSADMLTTVSPTYAAEIQNAAYGFRMDGLLRARADDLTGILNGVDTDVWNPASDTKIPFQYIDSDCSTDDAGSGGYNAGSGERGGKAKNKAALQKLFGFEVNPDIPLIAMISRFADQKGIAELFAPGFGCVYDMCSNIKLQFAVLGSGEKWCEDELRVLQAKLPNFRCRIGYDDSLSHLMEAGADFFLMPSRYEPCGLNQMYSLLYGTLPIVRRTGGLADTVENYNEQTGAGTGFMFDDLTPQSVYNTVGWAIHTWYNKKEHIYAMRNRAMKMKQQLGWDKSAQKYADVYAKALKRREDVCTDR